MVATPNFIDYLKSGLQLNLVAAIDFTGSNGMPSSPTSLHCISKQPTQYQLVLKSIWDIIENYDSDKKIPAFGFGAKPHFPNINSNQAVHCFPINDNPGNPEIQGFNNLMSSYVNAVSNMQFAGPTYFSPILGEAFGAAQKLQNTYSYQILLILTDGQIHDMAATKDIIVKNSNLPTSIIIVGIGNASFGNMEQLDGDGGLYGSNGVKCPRDIVQFVPFNKYNGNPQLLAAELLREIPRQVTQYFVIWYLCRLSLADYRNP